MNSKSLENLRPAQPGKSLNPGGRPRTTGLAKEIRQRFGADGKSLIDTCESLMHDPSTPAATKFAIASMLLDRGFGRPAAVVELDVTTSGDGSNCKPADYSRLSIAELTVLRDLERKAIGDGIEDAEIIEDRS